MKYPNIREEELKNKVGQDFFANYDTTQTVGNIDFCVTPKIINQNQKSFSDDSDWSEVSLLWAEAKKGKFDLLTMFTQLVLTIGKARTFDKFLPPAFIGAFDAEKIAFVPYNIVVDIFSMNDFNWNVAPSNHDTKEFHLIKDRIEHSLFENHYLYNFITDENELQFFIKNNIAKATESGKILIDKNNFVPIYLRWLDQVKPHINFDWAAGKKQNIHDNDFYLADLFVDDKGTSSIDDDTPTNDNLFVVFKNSHYEIAKENIKQLYDASIQINNKTAYEQFWKKYKRPPVNEFQQHIILRKDLLVPQDIRERKGAFFTPKQWVALSQQYITDTLGDNWQEEYYVWDCAAGTGNLLAGLTNKYNIYASTLDQSDVNAMHDRIENGAILLKNHCFQFDFLNDDFNKLPQSLQDIINNPKKRKKLVIYINPPYVESNGKTSIKRSKIQQTKTHTKYLSVLDKVAAELFAQFLARIYHEIQDCYIAQFSTLKVVSASNSKKFRTNFCPKLKKLFLVPASSFDNVKGSFPIGFFIWDTKFKENFETIDSDVYNSNGVLEGSKTIYSYDNENGRINEWLKKSKIETLDSIGFLMADAPDFQNNNYISILNQKTFRHGIFHSINNTNILEIAVYLSVRHSITATWLNDRDQFLYPNESWQTDKEFQNDCLTFALFHSQNRISCKDGTNHWIPFTEAEVNASEKFESNFMTQFLQGKIKPDDAKNDNLFIVSEPKAHYEVPLTFSEKAMAVFDSGRELWKYYHSKSDVNVNASLYDIREYFQGRNASGKMKNKSQDEMYNKLIADLRQSLKILAKKIEPKVYEYGFLKS
jgi:hypothetical protein